MIRSIETLAAILLIGVLVGECVSEYRRATRESAIRPDGDFGDSARLDESETEGESLLLGYVVGSETAGSDSEEMEA